MMPHATTRLVDEKRLIDSPNGYRIKTVQKSICHNRGYICLSHYPHVTVGCFEKGFLEGPDSEEPVGATVRVFLCYPLSHPRSEELL